MIYNELFESVIKAIVAKSENDVDLLSEPYDEFNTIGTPLIENVLFEYILREANSEEAVSILEGKIVIIETDLDKQKDDKTLKDFYRKDAIQKIKDKIWNFVSVENNPELIIQIVPRGIREWYHDTSVL